MASLPGEWTLKAGYEGTVDGAHMRLCLGSKIVSAGNASVPLSGVLLEPDLSTAIPFDIELRRNASVVKRNYRHPDAAFTKRCADSPRSRRSSPTGRGASERGQDEWKRVASDPKLWYTSAVPFRYGFILNAAETAESIVDFAVAAEKHGWDGIFIADAIGIETKDFPAFPFFDPWVLMGAMAVKTKRLVLGTMLTAVPRRRPWKLVKEVVTLDHLSGGRVILGTGLGAAEDDGGFYKVGEAMDLRTRAARLDEGLQVVAGLLTGKPFSFEGEHFEVDAMTLLPPPVQKPRVPLRPGTGASPRPRASRRSRPDGRCATS
jgi:hypothetical protein